MTPDLQPLRIVEPFPLADLPRLWVWMEQFKHQIFDDFGPLNQDEFVDLYMERLGGGDRTFAVYRGDVIGGFVSITAPDPCGVAESHCVFRKEFFGHQTTVPALKEVFGIVFADGVSKLATAIFSDNHAVAGLAKALGFQLEGTARKVRM